MKLVQQEVGSGAPLPDATPRPERPEQVVSHAAQVSDCGLELAQADCSVHHAAAELLLSVLVHIQELEQRAGIPLQVGTRGEQRALSGSPL